MVKKLCVILLVSLILLSGCGEKKQPEPTGFGLSKADVLDKMQGDQSVYLVSETESFLRYYGDFAKHIVELAYKFSDGYLAQILISWPEKGGYVDQQNIDQVFNEFKAQLEKEYGKSYTESKDVAGFESDTADIILTKNSDGVTILYTPLD